MRAKWLGHLESLNASLVGLAKAVGVEITEEEEGPDMVLEPANFEKHEFMASTSEDLVSQGFTIGADVAFKRRFTAEFTNTSDGKTQRKDIQKSDKGTIAGMAKGTLVVIVTKGVMEARVAVKAANLVVVTESEKKNGDAAAAAAAGGPIPKELEVPKGFQFLKAGGGEQMVVFEKWESLQARQDVDNQFRRVQNNVGFNVGQLADMLTNFTSEDLAICKRDGVVEVWTRRDFSRAELILAPETNEIKDRYWTAGRSVLCENGCDHHPSKKHIVLDGRMRAVPMPGASRPFSIFFCIQRGEPHNLVLGMSCVTLDVKVALPFQKTPLKRSLKEADGVQVPVAYNPAAIKKHTRLVLINDKQLQKIDDDMKKEAVKAAEAKTKSQAKADAAAADSGKQQPKQPKKK
jgi:hypothetical protein